MKGTDVLLKNRHRLDVWIARQQKIFDHVVRTSCETDWPDAVWRLDALRRSKEGSDTPLTINFGLAMRDCRADGTDRCLNEREKSFIDFLKAFVFAKAEKRNWDVSQATLNEPILAIALILAAPSSSTCEHPAEIVGRHFDDVQRILSEGITRRERFIERHGLLKNAKVNRFDDRGQLYITEKRAYGCTVSLIEIAKQLDAVRGGTKTIFTREVHWSNDRLDSRSLERERDKEALYPDMEAMYFLADLAQRINELNDVDRLMIRLFELMLVADKRIGEVVCLSVDSLVERNGVLGLRYRPKKNSAPFITWIPTEGTDAQEFKRTAQDSDSQWTASLDMFKRAVSDIIAITSSSRARAVALESAKGLEDVDFPEPSNCWPPLIHDLQIVGLRPGARLEEYYTREELVELGLNVRGRTRREGVELPEETKVSFRWRIDVEREQPFMQREDFRSLSREQRNQALKKFVEIRAAKRPESYLTLNRFLKLFADFPSSQAYPSRELQDASRWWRRYHQLVHGTDSVLNQLQSMISRLLTRDRVLVHRDDVRRYILGTYRSRRVVRRSPNSTDGLLLCNALFCVDDKLMHQRINYFPMVRLLSTASVRNWLRGSDGLKSIFERYGRPDLQTLVPHMLRRFNTTELRLAGVSNLYIARNAGRSIRRVDDYDYTSNDTLIEIAKTRLGTDVILEADYVKEQTKALEGHSISLNSIAQFIREQLVGRRVTDYGSCSHEYSIGGCPAFKACYMGCGEFWIRKGEPSEARQHMKDYTQTRQALEAARARLGVDFYASHYVVQYGAQLITLRRCLQIHADEAIPNGTFIKPMPEKRVPTADSIRALLDDDDTLEETLRTIDGLLAEAEDLNANKAN